MRIGKSRGPVKAQIIGSRSSRGWQASTSMLALVLAGGLAMPAPAHADDWLGTISNDWFNAGNWSAGVPTGAGTAVNINTVTPNPTVLNGGVATVGNVTLGASGDGSLVISGGGKLNSSNNGIIGDVFTGTATVTGVGSEWNSNGTLVVGLGGTGDLAVSLRGAVSAAAVVIGNTVGSVGTVTVDGSTLTSTGDLLVGTSGTGTLVVSNGGAVSSAIGSVGDFAGSTGTVTVTGAGATWTNSGNLMVGNSGTGTLNVLGGGTVTNFFGTIGAQASSSGSVTVDGAGSIWTNSGSLRVGDYGTGTLTISNGGVVSNDHGSLATRSDSVGTATVDGTGSTWTNNGDLFVGNGGNATLMISNGGAVSNNLGVIASGPLSTSSATVTGAGSTWTNTGSLTVGDSGTGTLNILSGGAITNNSGTIGLQAASSGSVTVDGTGSTWTNSGNLRVGDYGVGTLTISGGGVVSNDHGSLATRSDSAGTATVDGAGSTWTNNGDLFVGNGGNATLTISNGGAVSNNLGVIASGPLSTSMVTVTGTGSTWTNIGDLTVGDSGSGTLNILNGGSVSNVAGRIAAQAGSTGQVTVDGAGSTWANSFNLSVGIYGAGTLTVSNGGTVSSQSGSIASNVGSTGTVTVTGGGSSWANSINLGVGDGGVGTLNILNGGSVSNAIGVLGGFAAGSGTATVDGPGSTWTSTADLIVGNFGAGTLNVQNGGVVTNVTGRIAAQAGSTGQVTVDGAGSTWANSFNLSVGIYGAGTLTVSNGGTVSSQSGSIASNVGSTGTVTVTGGGSSWANSINLGVGDGGVGTLNILNGGSVSNAIGVLGGFAAGSGTATVDGPGSTWTNSSDLVVGGNGVGGLTVSNGGKVSSDYGYLGKNATGSGTAVVHGAASAWTSTNDLVVGDLGTGGLNILNGGSVSNMNGSIGNQAGSHGTALVDGAGSTWANSGDLHVGAIGTGALTIANGGDVTNANGFVGTGAGSIWTSAGALYVGADGAGTLTITNSGTVSALGGVRIAAGVGSMGTLNIGGAEGAAAVAAGVLNTTGVQFGAGTGKLNFNHTDTNYQFNAPIAGAGEINQVAGTTVLTGNSSGFTGSTNVTGGRLLVNGTLGGTTAVMSGGTLGGSGNLTGPVSVVGGGTLLGVQGQTLGLGSLVLGTGSNINVALGAPGGAGLFNVAGNLTLDGTLNVSNAGGFGAGVYRVIDYGGALTDNGMAVGTLPLGTTGTVQTAVANQVNLLVSGTTLDTQFWNGTTTLPDGTIHGGSGVWTAGPTTNWTDVNGLITSSWAGNFAVFQNNPGAVTVDTSAGAVSTTGMQFIGQNWTVGGGPITLNGAGGATTIRVGDGTAAGASDYTTISSELTGASRLVKDDLGFLLLTGTNTYTGGTTINAGALQLGDGGTTGSIQGDIVNNGRLFFNRSDVLTLGGAISGSGTTSQLNGRTVLTGNSSGFAGTTSVNGGTLQVDGTLGGTTSVQNGGSLAGSGTLSGPVTVANGATLLGAQGQTLSMGSLALSGGSNVNVALGAPGGAGLFNVAGNLTLDGTLNVSDAGGFGVGVYRIFDYGGTLTNNGLDLGLMPTGTTGTVQTSVANKVNLVVNGTGPGSVQFWNGTTTTADGTVHGGSGVWTAGPTTNWTDAAGAQANAWAGNFAVFQNNPGAITVDGSAGAVAATGMQFIGQGWMVSGAPITLNGAGGSTTIRVGDGTAAGAADYATIGSELTGASRLVKDDLGTLILTGANSYSGGTAINAGTLQIGNGGTTGSILGNVADNGLLAFNRSDATTFDGVISGAGAVDVRSGALTFTADHGYAGLTSIANSAELRLGNGGTTGSVAGNIANNGTLRFNRSNELVYGGVISGNGAIDHLTGRTVLTGNSSGFTGTTDVIGGQLVVNGSLGGALSVLSGGTLGGSGTVGNLLVAGTVAPGNSIGTLNVNGNIGFAAGSIYQVEANAAGQADKIVATGTATLNGGTVQVLAGTGIYAPATAYTILTANGGVTGTFTGGVTSNLAFLDPTLTYDASNVYLTLTRNNIDFAGVGLTPNQIAAGGGAESLGFGNPVYNAVLNLSDTQAQYAFDQLSGEIHASARTALIEDSRFVRNAVNDRLRAAFDGVGASGGNVVTYENGKPRTAAANTDGGAFWGQGFGSWGHTNSDGNAARLERSTGGFLMGADAPVFDTWRFGAVAGYSYTDFNVKDRHSSGSADNFHLGLYGGNQWGDLAFRSGLAYTWHDIHTARTIAFPGFSDSTKGGYSAGTFQAFGELGYKVQAGAVQFEPFANLAYVSLNTSGFRETGGAAALTGASATTDATFTTLGLRASTSFELGGATATAKGMVGWRHAFGDTTPLAAMAFASGGDTFSIGGVPIARDAAVFETGLDIALSPTATVGVTYGGQFGSGVSDQSIKANFSLKF